MVTRAERIAGARALVRETLEARAGAMILARIGALDRPIAPDEVEYFAELGRRMHTWNMATEFPFDIALRATTAQLQRGMAEGKAILQRGMNDFERIGKSMGGGDGGAFNVVNALKFGAVVQGVQGAFTGLESVARLFKGDTEGALAAIERLPLGIGPAIAAGRRFFEVISGSAEKAALIAKHLQDTADFQKLAGGASSESADARIAAIAKERDAKVAEAIAKFRPTSTEAEDTIRRLNRGLPGGVGERSDPLAGQPRSTLDEVINDIISQAGRKIFEIATQPERDALARERADADDAERVAKQIADNAAEDKKLMEKITSDLAKSQAKVDESAKAVKEIREAPERRNFSNAVLISDRFRGHAVRAEDAATVAGQRVEAAVKDGTAKLQEAIRVGFRDLPRNLPGGILL